MSRSFGEVTDFGGSVGRISGLLGLGVQFRTKFVRLLGLGYALRLKLPLFIFAGFAVSHLIINYIPRVIVEFEVEEEEVEEDSQDEEDSEDEDAGGGGAAAARHTSEAFSQTQA